MKIIFFGSFQLVTSIIIETAMSMNRSFNLVVTIVIYNKSSMKQ